MLIPRYKLPITCYVGYLLAFLAAVLGIFIPFMENWYKVSYYSTLSVVALLILSPKGNLKLESVKATSYKVLPDWLVLAATVTTQLVLTFFVAWVLCNIERMSGLNFRLTSITAGDTARVFGENYFESVILAMVAPFVLAIILSFYHNNRDLPALFSSSFIKDRDSDMSIFISTIMESLTVITNLAFWYVILAVCYCLLLDYAYQMFELGSIWNAPVRISSFIIFTCCIVYINSKVKIKRALDLKVSFGLIFLVMFLTNLVSIVGVEFLYNFFMIDMPKERQIQSVIFNNLTPEEVAIRFKVLFFGLIIAVGYSLASLIARLTYGKSIRFILMTSLILPMLMLVFNFKVDFDLTSRLANILAVVLIFTVFIAINHGVKSKANLKYGMLAVDEIDKKHRSVIPSVNSYFLIVCVTAASSLMFSFISFQVFAAGVILYAVPTGIIMQLKLIYDLHKPKACSPASGLVG